jgi:hypothetical protein
MKMISTDSLFNNVDRIESKYGFYYTDEYLMFGELGKEDVMLKFTSTYYKDVDGVTYDLHESPYGDTILISQKSNRVIIIDPKGVKAEFY